MKKVRGNFSYQTNQAPMGALSDSLIDSALSMVASKLQSDPAQREQAVQTITDVIKEGIVNNAGLIITGLFIFGLSMAAANVGITSYVLKNNK